MQKGINLAINDFNQVLVTVINNSGLPAGVVKLCLENAMCGVDRQYDMAVASERAEYKQTIEEEKAKKEQEVDANEQ